MQPGGKEAPGTRDRLLALLRRGPATVDDLARGVGVTSNSIRVQLASLERDGLVRREGVRRLSRKPAHLFVLSAEAERAFSRAYLPVLTALLQVVGERLGPDATTEALREVGRRIARTRPRHPPAAEGRLGDALDLLGELGGLAEVERHDGTVRVSAHGCPLGEVVQRDPRVCLAMESLLAEVVGAPVHETCQRSDRPSCRFEIELPEHAP